MHQYIDTLIILFLSYFKDFKSLILKESFVFIAHGSIQTDQFGYCHPLCIHQVGAAQITAVQIFTHYPINIPQKLEKYRTHAVGLMMTLSVLDFSDRITVVFLC